MIEKIAIQNYKSLENVELELTPLTVFVGPNNAGKSNILDCLKLLSELVTQGGILSSPISGTEQQACLLTRQLRHGGEETLNWP